MRRRIVAVGAGINGLLTAYCCAKAGHAVSVLDRGAISDQAAASYGMHRLIHPWSQNGDGATFDCAVSALENWHGVLSVIGCAGFIKCGVFAVSADNGLEALARIFCQIRLHESGISDMCM